MKNLTTVFLVILCSVLVLPLAFAQEVTFSDPILITGHTPDASSVFSADLDGDGDYDVLSASPYDDKIAWYENTDGLGSFGPQQIITTIADGVLSVFSADLDGDGDYDVLSASADDDKIAWYENTDGLGNYGPQQIITTSADYATSVFSADLDGDGDYDVLSASYWDDKIAWYENTDGLGSFGPQQIITSALNATSVFSIDLDGDGDYDVLSASSFDNKIAWYENTNGLGSFGPQQVITTSAGGAWSVFSADLDGDGDYDVLSASSIDYKIAWYENTDGLGSFGPQQIITTSAISAISVFSADLDGDGDYDVLSASSFDDKIAWYENNDGFGMFGPQQIITTSADGAKSVFSADLDGDGDYDVLSASRYDDKIAWYENTDGQGSFGQQKIVTTSAVLAMSVFSADLDGDGDYDVLSASAADDKIAWYENTDGLGSFSTQQIITTCADWAESVFSADLDGDGDYDVLSASSYDNKIAWYENTDGLGNFGPQQEISTDANNAKSVYCADLDGDGDYDVLSASWDDDKIAWYENTDGLGSFGPQQIITTSADGANSVFSVDLDGDECYDVLSASFNDYKIASYENTDGLGTFGPQQIITNNAHGAISVFSADLDGDEDYDVLSASSCNCRIAWYENTDGLGNFGPQQIINACAIYATSVFSADMDGDGDYDVLSASSLDNKIAWYENTDGLGSFGPQQIITTSAEGAESVFSADLDGDGDNDVLSASWGDNKIAWYRNIVDESDLDLTIFPIGDPVEIPYMGLLFFDAVLTNNTDDDITYDAWITVIFPNGWICEDPSLMRFGLNIAADETREWNLHLCAPECATEGEFVFIGHVGEWPDNVIDSETFTFEILPMQGGGAEHDESEWTLYGWDDDVSSDVTASTSIPVDLGIDQIYPNPFNPVTSVTIALPTPAELKVAVFNVMGQEVALLVSGHYSAGYHSFTFSGDDLASGLYFIHASVSGKLNEVRKVIILK